MKHNPTEFTQDLPALLDLAVEYRDEILKKAKDSNPEQPLDGIIDQTILMMGIKDFGFFKQPNESVIPTKDDYLFHLTLMLLEHCCTNDRIQNIIPRVIMNNLAIKLSQNEMKMELPRHQMWAMQIFHKIRSDLVPDYISKLQLGNLVTEDLLVDCAKK